MRNNSLSSFCKNVGQVSISFILRLIPTVESVRKSENILIPFRIHMLYRFHWIFSFALLNIKENQCNLHLIFYVQICLTKSAYDLLRLIFLVMYIVFLVPFFQAKLKSYYFIHNRKKPSLQLSIL